MEIDIKGYLREKELTIYEVSKRSGYGYTTLHKSFNKQQTRATSLNLRDLDALAKAQHVTMWQVKKFLEPSAGQGAFIDSFLRIYPPFILTT